MILGSVPTFNTRRNVILDADVLRRATIGQQDHNPAPENSKTIAITGTARSSASTGVEEDPKGQWGGRERRRGATG
jgi:hypothetical protein